MAWQEVAADMQLQVRLVGQCGPTVEVEEGRAGTVAAAMVAAEAVATGVAIKAAHATGPTD